MSRGLRSVDIIKALKPRFRQSQQQLVARKVFCIRQHISVKIISANEDFYWNAFLLLKEFILLTPECLWGDSFFKRYNVVERHKIDCKSEFSNTKIKEQWKAFDMVARAVVPNVMFFDFLYHADDWRLCVALDHNDAGQYSSVTNSGPFCNIGKIDIGLFDYPFLSLHLASTGKSSCP